MSRFDDSPGWLVSSRDGFGPLPEVLVPDGTDRWKTCEQLSREAAKLHAISEIRRSVANYFGDPPHFLVSVATDGCFLAAVVSVEGQVHLGVGCSHLEAYHNLWHVVRQTMVDDEVNGVVLDSR